MSPEMFTVPVVPIVRRILVIDEDPQTAALVHTLMVHHPCDVKSTATSVEATETAISLPVHLVIADIAAPLADGGVLTTLRSRFPSVPLICVATDATPEQAASAIRFGATDYLPKPLDSELFKERILQSLLKPSAFPDSLVSPEGVTTRFGMIGTSPRMQKLHDLIDRFSFVDCCVTILGPTGSGKELVARALHDAGPRRAKPFVPVDCAALTPSLIEAELFGHVEGAFTGAFADRTGPLAAAKDGTVFLDEIGELPLELQSKLLRAIQERAIRPLGTNETVRLNARFVVATNKDLFQCATKGTFRWDLYFRLAGVRIMVPALREHKTDIPLLTEAFLEEANRMVRTKRVISDSVMRKLINYSWPGNVRELKSVIERAVILSEGRVIEIQDLPSEISDIELPWNVATETSTKTEDSFNIAELESRTIRRALSKARGDKLLAAKMLGIGKTTLYRKLKRMEQNEAEALQSAG